MKLTQDTIEILKNYSTINQSILVKAGNKLSTISNMRTILSEATVTETFPVTFGIYDLNKFLAKYSHHKDCELNFDADRVVFVSQNNKRRDYIKYCSEKVIVSPGDKKIGVDSYDVEFDLSYEDLDWQRKNAGISGSPNFVFRSDGDKILLVSTDVKDDSSDVSSTEIADGNGSKFEVVMKVEYFKIVEGAYKVQIAKKGLAKFTNTKNNVVYYIAIESTQSKFE